MKWLYYLFRLFKCPHKWEHLEKIRVYAPGHTKTNLPIYMTYVLKCRRCGAIKRVKTE